jgi:hypothetical protein
VNREPSPQVSRAVRGGRSIAKARKPVVLGVVGALVAGLLVVLAVRAEGYPVTDVELTASTVWVTNDAKGVVGRVNRQIDELNSAVKANKPGFDVLQEADTVLVRDTVKQELRPVDVAAVILTGRIGIPEAASVSFGGGVIGVTDQTTGALWAGTVDSMTGLDPETTEPLLTTGAGAVVATSVHGRVFAVAPGRDELWSTQLTDDGGPRDWATGDDGKPVPPEPARLTGGSLTPVAALVVSQQSPSVQLTTVGEVPVVLDRGTGELILPDRRVRIPGGAEAVLQQPGPDSAAVLVSTATSMLSVPLAAGDPVTVADGVSGVPSAPVWLSGCAHGAWAAAQSSYAVACGSDPARVIDVPKAGAAATLVFRVNRSVIVLNDQASGNVWLVDADMKLISDWDNVQPQQDSSDVTAEDGDQNSSDQLTNSRADCVAGAGEAAAPEAAADAFGIRAGRSSLLPVLDNDASADCSMVVISAVTPLPPEAGSVAIANGGQALQVTVPAGATGALPAVQYTVDDGQGRQATAAVTVTVAAVDDTRAPVKVRDSVTLVEVGGTVSYTVLPDFRSPVGDDLSLIAASSTTDDSVTFQPNGMITFRDTGSAGAVKKTVDFTVSDGTSQTGGQLIIDVKPEGSTKPVAGPVVARGVVGETVTSYPLRGVLSGIREPVKVTAVAPLTAPSGTPAATAQLSTLDSTVTLTGATAGTTYFLYTVVAGAGTATGVLRFDVTDPPATPVPPVMTPDVGYLVPGRTLVIDPLANDVDPMGSVLAIQGLSRSADSPLTATVHDLQLVQVSSSRTVPTGGVTLTYTAANAAGSSAGQIRVIPVPAPTTPQPPVASDIAVTVRAGEAVTIPIARYATDPTGERLTVKPFAAQTIPDDQGLLFATESAIRYLAPAVPPPTTVRFSYSVVNTDQLSDTRTVTISVTPADPAVNSAPRAPEQVTARVFAGHSTTIGLPLDGLDPDGDWVTLAGQTDPAPTLGRVDRAGPAAITYTALGAPGLDTTGYLAADTSGKQVKGSARIAVIAPPDVAEPPVAPDLDVVVRPGRTVAIDALGAASDPGGNTPFRFADPALVLPPGLAAELVNDTIVLTAPEADGVFPIKYTVRNSKGLAASGILTVTVSATAPLAPPTAKDVFIEAGSLSADGATAGVDVASAVTNRSGQVSDLSVELDASTAARAASTTAAPTVSGTAITVPVTDTRQVLAYRVTNLDGDTATAFVVVPPRGELAPPAQQNQQTEQPAAPPQARANVEPFTITAGQTAAVPVLDYVQVDAGRTALVPEGAAMNASQGTVQRLDNATLQYSVPDTAGGNAVINVQVTDGTSAAVFIPIPVVIIPTVIPPPVFTGASISVEKGSSTSQDLSGLVSTATDAQRESLTFSGPSGLGNGLSGSLDGSILTVTADTSTQRGASSTATLTVSDGTNSVTGSVAVSVVGSTAALAGVAANRQVEATAGQPVSIPVLDGAYNPFPDTPLTIVAANASGGVPVQISASTLIVTPPAGALDQLALSFTVADATGDADRQVQGTVTVIPLAKPDAPTAVVATSLGKPDSVDVAWRAPALTRPAITSYTIYWPGGSASCAADAGHCPVGPLTPGTSYTFEVSATNDQGEGARSAPSAEITPDVEPDVPAAPTVTWTAPGSVTVAWKPPNNSGSAIASYLLTASTGAVRTVAAGEGTSSVFTGLDPATEVNFTVSATNSTGKTSQTSAASNSLYPSDTTRAPGKPDLQAGTDAGGTRTIAVTWAAAEPRGDPADSYLVTVNGSPSTVTAPTTSFTIGGVRDGVEYAVSVAARNHVGDSASSDVTTLITSPDVANVTAAEATGTDRQIRVTVAPSTTAGGQISSYEIYAGGSRVGSGGTSQDVTVGSNGTSYSFTARACVNGTCSSDGGAAKSASAYGPVGGASVSVTDTSQTQVRFTWSAPGDNGRGPMQTRYNVDGGGWSGWAGGGGTVVVGNACAQGHSIQVQGRDSAGLEGPVGSTSGSSNACPPPPSPTVTRILNRDATGHTGTSPGSVTCLGPRCRFIDVQVTNFPAGVSVVCSVLGRPATPRTTDGAGSVFFDWGWYSGTPEGELATCSGGGVTARG